MQCPAWRDLSSNARAAYLEVASGYDGQNNGRIVVASQLLGEHMGCNKSTAARALCELETHGFIVCHKKGGFVCKVRHASEWRLTAFKCNVTGDLPLKPFMQWKPQIQKSVAQAQPISGMGATVRGNQPQKTPSRWHGCNRKGQLSGSHGGTGATLLYSNHTPSPQAQVFEAQQGAANPRASDPASPAQVETAKHSFDPSKAFKNLADELRNGQSLGHVNSINSEMDPTSILDWQAKPIKSLCQMDRALPDELKSWQPVHSKQKIAQTETKAA